MANYAASILATAQTVLNRKYNEAELRRKIKPVLQMAVRNQDYTIPNHQEVRKAEARPVDAMYLKKKSAGSATAKVALHTGTKGDSGKVTLSWSVFTETFYTSVKQAQNNVIGFQTMFNHELEQAINNLKDRAETAGLAALVAGRCQIAAPATSGQGSWNGTNFALEVAAADANYFAQKIRFFMLGRYYAPDFDVVADLIQAASFEKVQNQGAGNSTNTSFQFNGLNIAPTTETILSAYTGGSALVMPAGTFAGLWWNDPENRKGFNSGENNVGMLGTLADPFGLNIQFDVSKYTVRGDESSNGGHVQDILDQWEVTLQIGWALPPIALTSDSPVHLIAQAA